MPTNITDVLTFTAPIVAPADGDAETGASVATGFQGLANRTALANNVLNTTGVTLIRTGNSAAMTALVMTAGMVGQVFLRTGFGVYVYANPSALPVDSQWVFTAAGAASGQWVHELYGNLNQSIGLPTIGPAAGNGTPSGRILQSIVPYGVVGTPYYNAGPVSMSTASASVVALTGGLTINLGSLLVGDIVEMVAPAQYSCTNNSSFAAYVSENAGAYFNVSGTNLYNASTSYAAGVLSFIRTVGNAGTYGIQFQGFTFGGASLSLVVTSIYARVTRP